MKEWYLKHKIRSDVYFITIGVVAGCIGELFHVLWWVLLPMVIVYSSVTTFRKYQEVLGDNWWKGEVTEP